MSPRKKGEASMHAHKTARGSRSRSSYEPGVLSFRGFERLSAIGHDLVREFRGRLGRGGQVLCHAPNDKKLVNADFVNIAVAFILADVRALIEGSFDVKIRALFQFDRKRRQVPVEDQAEPIGMLGRIVVASEAIGLAKPGIRTGTEDGK